jgi:hypothetical protein
MNIRRELDKRRQSKADVASVAAHKQTMLGLLRATVSNRGDSPEQAQRRRFAAGDPEAVVTSSDGSKRSTTKPYPKEGKGHVSISS